MLNFSCTKVKDLINYSTNEDKMIEKRLKIKKAIQQSGLKQKFIADKIGVSEISLSYWIIGQRNPSKEHIKSLAKLLRCKMSDLED